MSSKVNNLKNTYAVIQPNQAVEKVAVSPSVYQELDENFNHFKGHQLVSMHEFEEDWAAWEIHPKGDEVVVLLSGRITLRLDIDGEHQKVELREQGDFVVVPQNTWHTAHTQTPSKVLFITPGEATEYKSI